MSFKTSEHFKELRQKGSVAFVLKILGMLFGYLFIFIISQYEGARGVGVFSLTLALLGILEVFGTLGCNNSILRFVSDFSYKQQWAKIRPFYISAIKLVTPLVISIAVLIYFFATTIAKEIFHNEALITPIRIISFIIPFSVINQLNVELIRGLKNISLSEYLRKFNWTIFAIIFFVCLHPLLKNDSISILAYGFGIVLSFVFSSSYIYKITGKYEKTDEQVIGRKELLKVSLPMMMVAVSLLVMGNIDTLMLGSFLEVRSVGIYSVAFQLAAITSFVLQAINTIAAPKFSELYWSKKKEELVTVVRYASKMIFYSTVPIALVLLVAANWFLGLFGEGFQEGRVALMILIAGQFVNAIAGSVGYYLIMTGKQNIYQYILITATILNIGLNYFLIPRYGINGAAIATTISMSLWNIVGAVYIQRKENVKTYYFPLICK